MKKLSLLFVIILIISSCEQDSIVTEFEEFNSEQSSLAKKGDKVGKIDVCHKGKIINVSVDALSAHRGHGDGVDMDGDGYFDIENDCSEIDCDDANADLSPSVEDICGNGIDDNCDGNVDEDCSIRNNTCDVACGSDGMLCDYLSLDTIMCYYENGVDMVWLMFADGSDFSLTFNTENEACFNYIFQFIDENNVPRCGG